MNYQFSAIIKVTKVVCGYIESKSEITIMAKNKGVYMDVPVSFWVIKQPDFLITSKYQSKK